MSHKDTEPRQNYQVRSAENRDIAEAAPKGDSSPVKAVQSTRTDKQCPGVEGKQTEQVAQTIQQEPKPKSQTSSHASAIEPNVERSGRVFSQLRKRQIDGDSEGDDSVSENDDNEHRQKLPRLTRRNLAQFNKMGKKTRLTDPTDPTDDSNTISTTTSGFAIQAYKNGILEARHSKPPTNLDDLYARHARSRATSSPPESRYKSYVNKVEAAVNEATMVYDVGSHMLKEYDDDIGYHHAFNHAFSAYQKDFGFNHGLSAPQPDFIEGLEMQKFRPVPINEYVTGAVLHKDNPGSLTLPHLAGEWKGRGKNMEEARMKSSYDGAALVYARTQALSRTGKPDPPGHAEVTTFTTDGTNLNLYAHYAVPSEEGTPEYHQYLYASENLKDSYQGYKDGRRGLRNAQDHAKEKSYALRDQLKEHWKRHRGDLRPIAEGAPLLSVDGLPMRTDGDEEEDDAVTEGAPLLSVTGLPMRTDEYEEEDDAITEGAPLSIAGLPRGNRRRRRGRRC